MNKKFIKKIWLEKFPIFLLDGIDNQKFLNGLTTSNMVQPESNIIRTCLLNPKGVLKSLLEIHYVQKKLLILILEGNVNEIRKHFEDIIFPADKVEISNIKTNIRIQEVDDLYSWRKSQPILLSENNCDDYIFKNSLSVMDPTNLKIWKIKQAIPTINFEINGKNNPLELGLADLIDFKKGCFLGQEIMSKLKNVSSLKQEIRVWKSNHPTNNLKLIDEKVYLENNSEKIVGYITRYTKINAKEFIGLVMIKRNYLEDNNNFFSKQFGIIKLHRSIGSVFL